MEIWKDIPEWEGLYQASDLGRVRSYDKKCPARFGKPVLRRGRILKPVAKGERYLAVTLSNGSNRKQFFVHDLILKTFVGDKPKGYQVCHVNDQKTDNRLTNIRYGTAKDNSDDAIRNGVKPRGESHGIAKLTNKDVLEIRNCPTSNKDLALKFGVTESHIWGIRNRRTWKHL